MSKTLQIRCEQFHTYRIGEFLDPFNSAVTSYLGQALPAFYRLTGDAAVSRRMSLQSPADLRQQQALSMAYLDVFWLAAVLALALVPLVLLMKRSVAEKGEHIGAESTTEDGGPGRRASFHWARSDATADQPSPTETEVAAANRGCRYFRRTTLSEVRSAGP
jgi:hypothetical protein